MSVGVVFKISYSRNEPMKLNLSSHIYDLYTVLADVAARRVGAQGLASSPAGERCLGKNIFRRREDLIVVGNVHQNTGLISSHEKRS